MTANRAMPTSEAEVQEFVKCAHDSCEPFCIEGGGSRAVLGRKTPAGRLLSLSAMSGIVRYSPAEMFVSVLAGTPASDVEKLLAGRDQMLPFEPMDHRVLFSTNSTPSIGAIAACNISGPRSVQVGAARDFLLGVRFVNGRGEIIKAGGCVTKNVTGLDLTKLQSGAFGTLGVLTEVIFRTLPKAPFSATLSYEGLNPTQAISAFSTALSTPMSVSGAAYAPSSSENPSRALLRLEGRQASVSERALKLRRLLKEFGEPALIGDEESIVIWTSIRDVVALAEPNAYTVWKLTAKPSLIATLVDALMQKLTARYLLDAGGAIAWIAVSSSSVADALLFRKVVAEHGGYATIVRASDEIRSTVDVFHPQPEAIMGLTRRIKCSFDPNRILNRDRMYRGI
ncbi:MAG: FAD-binding protein [Rhizobiales bacterium]|nr:FAD-binding protein [Hyphomicrobiales bacterium]